MPLSNSILSYEDIQKVLDKALEADIGLSLTFNQYGQAINFRQRCYKFRQLSHKASMTAFDENDLRYGTSMYDTIKVVIREKDPGEPWVVEIRKIERTNYDSRELKV